MVPLAVEGASRARAVGNLDRRIQAEVGLLPLGVVEERSHGQSIPVTERDGVGPLQKYFLGVPADVGIPGIVEGVSGIRRIEAHVPPVGRLQRVPQVRKSSPPCVG